jgi:hypothetical protein
LNRIIIYVMLVAGVAVAPAQLTQPRRDAGAEEHCLNYLLKAAERSHSELHIDDEITSRQQYSTEAWSDYRYGRKTCDSSVLKYDKHIERWTIIYGNDLPLAMVLEGAHRWAEAEALYRRNREQLADERVAGDDIKSSNELHLAHLLAREGKTKESMRICSKWRRKMNGLAKWALDAVRTNSPTPPLYDTPEVEMAKWNLACGKEEDGIALLQQQMASHPDMLASHTALEEFYVVTGKFDRELENRARRMASKKLEAQAVQVEPLDPDYCTNEPVKPNLHLQSTVTVRGQLRDRSGAAFANKTIEIRRFVSTTKHVVVASKSTDSEGKFELGSIPSGDYRFIASFTRVFKQPNEDWCKPDVPCELDLVLDVNPTDQPYSNCPVR